MPRVGAATIKGESLRLSLASAWRADPERSPCDTVAGEISDGRRGEEDSPNEGISPSLEERSSTAPYRMAPATNGSDGRVRFAL